MTYLQFVAFCMRKGLTKEQVEKYCLMSQQDTYTEDDYIKCQLYM